MSVVGIDFGNLDCILAQAKRGGIDIILNENSNRRNPNLVSFQGKQRLMGEAAVSVARSNYKNTATNIKLLIGKKFQDASIQEELKYLPFTCVENERGEVSIRVSYNDEETFLSCEQIVAMMLFKLKQIAEAANDGVAVSYAVIGVPYYFTDVQRNALLSASKIAGLNCLRVMNENSATALSHGIYKSARNVYDENKSVYVMFVDMGHHNYTVSLVSFTKQKLTVLAVAGDQQLGGRNIDLAISQYMAAEFKKKTGLDAMNNSKSFLKLMAAAEKAKKNLSPAGVTSSGLTVECLMDEQDYSGKLSLEEFENMIAPFLNRLEGPIAQVLETAKLDKSQLECVEIIGGGTRVASVKRKLSEVLGLDASSPNFGLSTTLNADESVARGCALQCAILSPLFKVKDFEIVDTVTYPIRLTWEQEELAQSTPMDTTDDAEDAEMSENSIVIFKQSDEFPKTRRVTFRRSQSFEIFASYDETARSLLPGNSNLNICKFIISGISTKNNEPARIRVNFSQNINGTIQVTSAHLMQEIEESVVEAATTTENAATATENASPEGAEKKEPAAAAGTGAGTGAGAASKKKRYRKVELTVERISESMTVDDLNKAFEQEVAMAQQDRIIEETANKRNDLESYIYAMRNHLSDHLRQFVSEADASILTNKLQSAEDWLYSDEGFDSTKKAYETKLNELTCLGNPIEHRYKESTERPAAVSDLNMVSEEFKKVVNSSDEKYSHLSDDERNKVRTECTNAETWVHEQLARQGDLKSYDNPILASSMIRTKIANLQAACKPIVNKKKPAPPKPEVETPPAPVDNSTENKTTENATEKMDLD